jgi:hypothetical protein
MKQANGFMRKGEWNMGKMVRWLDDEATALE